MREVLVWCRGCGAVWVDGEPPGCSCVDGDPQYEDWVTGPEWKQDPQQVLF